jgi:hypothetical protein
MRLPICGCGRVMTCTKTGMSVLLHTNEGLEHQLWASDEFTCPSCSAKVALIQSAMPIAEHYQGGFDRAKRAASTPDGRLKLFNAYYGDVPDSHLHPNIAGVKVDVQMEITSDPNAAVVSSVDSTTAPTEDAQHHESSKH